MYYNAIHRAGAPVSSGAAESPRAQLRRRFCCRGPFWMCRGLSRLLKLVVLFRNQDDTYLWN